MDKQRRFSIALLVAFTLLLATPISSQAANARASHRHGADFARVNVEPKFYAAEAAGYGCSVAVIDLMTTPP